MLNKKDLVEKMKKHFPRWMDIRKRVNKSDGGKLLTSVAEEIAEIQSAIDDYKRDFFIDGYEGREDDITAFVYRTQIGVVDTTSLSLVLPAWEITTDLKAFETHNTAYYENGYLYFKESDTNFDSITYSVYEYKTTALLEKMHVWNVFDEFAYFTGIERHEGEKNSDLVKRILDKGTRNTNSTTEGLKNVILNELLNIDQELIADDIKIEQPTPANLVKYYKEFGSIIEKLEFMNRDVYRTKRWDVDTWVHDFKSVDYIPHAWDALIEECKNGIGMKDDLEVVVSDPGAKTDADVMIYEKSESSVVDYIKKNNIKKTIPLMLQRYENILQPVNMKYKVSASEATYINDLNIEVQALEKIAQVEERYLDDIIDNSTDAMKDIIIGNRMTMEVGKKYIVRFLPKTSYGTMEVGKLNLVSRSRDGQVLSTQNIMAEKDGFIFDENNDLYYRNVMMYAKYKHQFSSYNNIINVQDGMAIDDLATAASLSLNLNGMNNQPVMYNIKCNTTPVPSNAITFDKFSRSSDGSIVSDPLYGVQKTTSIMVTGNQVTVDIESGDCMITYRMNGQDKQQIFYGGCKFSTPSSNRPGPIFVKIASINNSTIKIRSIEYSNYTVDIALQSGVIALLGNGQMALPDISENTMLITMKTETGFSPILEYMHIGPNLLTANSGNPIEYKTGIITPTAERTEFEIETNCKTILVEMDELETEIMQQEFDPHRSYFANTDNSYIKLDLSDYSNISSLKTYSGKFKSVGSGSSIEYYLMLSKSEACQSIIIDGERLVKSSKYSLQDLLSADVSSGDEIFTSSILNGFIIRRGYDCRLVSISPNRFNRSSTEEYTFIGLPNELSGAFMTNTNNNSIVMANTYSGRFESAFIVPKNNKSYMVYNQTKVVKQDTSDIDIVTPPFMPQDKMMVYKIDTLTSDLGDVRFEDGDNDFMTLNNWHLGIGKLKIKANIDDTEKTNYEVDTKAIEKEFSISNVIPLEKFYTVSSGEILETARYDIELPAGMEIVYRQWEPDMTADEQFEFFYEETIPIEDDGFNKLKYCHIDDRDECPNYIRFAYGNVGSDVDPEWYQIMPEEGIVVWRGEARENYGSFVSIGYTYKIPDHIKMDLDTMYDVVEHNISAYKQTSISKLEDMADKTVVEIENDGLFEKGTDPKIITKCSSPGFEAWARKTTRKVQNEDKEFIEVTFKKVAADNAVIAKTGYFYSDGDEFYLFSSDSTDPIDRFNNATLYNVNREDNRIELSKSARNFVKNSYMTTSIMANLFNINFKKDERIFGVSRLGSITACNSFNHWRTFGTQLYISNGYNGIGIQFNPVENHGYGYLDITDDLTDDTYLSFYKRGDLVLRVGREKKVLGMSLSKTTLIELTDEAIKSQFEDDMYECRIKRLPDYKYYIVVEGNGTLDDIIVYDASKRIEYVGAHKKNIDYLKLGIQEHTTSSYTTRLYLDDNSGAICDGAEISNNGTITNSSLIDWGITKAKTINSKDAWTRCILTGVDYRDGSIKTMPKYQGSIETDPIFIGNTKTVKNFICKINDVMFENMSGFAVKILTSSSYSGPYRSAASFNDNIGVISGKYLLPYVKIMIDMPGGKMISNIEMFIEYKSTNEAAPVEISVANGVFVSKIFDSHYTACYKINNIEIESLSNIKDVSIQIRAAKDSTSDKVWTEWKNIFNENMEIQSDLEFNGYRFFQIKVLLKKKEAYIKLKHIDLEVI